MVVHWDGKTLKVCGQLESKRVCVYVSGVEEEQVRKLLGIPETSSGKGEEEFKVVKEKLKEWGLKEEVVDMVFDTTASNSGEHSGPASTWRGGWGAQSSGWPAGSASPSCTWERR